MAKEIKKDLRPALWLVAEGEHVLLKIEYKKGHWITLIKERLDSPFSHILQPDGVQAAIDKTKLP